MKEDGARVKLGLWSVILAGGEGTRTRSFVERWLGRPQPKQYCTFLGTRSLFQHTVDRADRLAPPGQRVTVAAARHCRLLRAQLRDRVPGHLVWQPQDRGTAAGVFLPLGYVRGAHPDATAILYPSDHFIHPEDRFIDAVALAVRAVDHEPGKLVLLGVVPDRPEVDYGWIQPGKDLANVGSFPFRSVRRFIEKPNPVQAMEAMSRGALWNTLIVAGKVETFWKVGQYCLPQMMFLFEWIAREVGTRREQKVLETMYEILPDRNFSSDVLEKVPERLTVMELAGVEWSDWGRPERIAESIRRLGRKPAFPPGLLPSSSASVAPGAGKLPRAALSPAGS